MRKELVGWPSVLFGMRYAGSFSDLPEPAARVAAGIACASAPWEVLAQNARFGPLDDLTLQLACDMDQSRDHLPPDPSPALLRMLKQFTTAKAVEWMLQWHLTALDLENKERDKASRRRLSSAITCWDKDGAAGLLGVLPSEHFGVGIARDWPALSNEIEVRAARGLFRAIGHGQGTFLSAKELDHLYNPSELPIR